MIPTLLMMFAAAAPPEPPRLGESPAVRPHMPPAPTPDEPRSLSANRLRLFWVEQYSGTIPLRWSTTPLDEMAKVDCIDLPAKSPAIGILEGESRAKAHFAQEAATNTVAVWGVSPGRVLLQADGVQEGRIVTIVRVIISVGPTPPVPPDPPPPPPDKPPASLYFLIVRPNGPASPKFTAVLANPAWDELRKVGHSVKDKTLNELGDWYRIPAGTTLPCVVTLRISDGRSTVVRGPIDLPTTSDSIRRLPEDLP